MKMQDPPLPEKLIEKLKLCLNHEGFSDAVKIRSLERFDSIFNYNSNVHDDALFVELQNVASSIYIESSKQNLNGDALLNILTLGAIQDRYIEVLKTTYQATKESIQRSLNLVGCQTPKILQTAWKMNFELETSMENAIDSPRFVISANVDSGGEHFSDFRFVCNSEQIQDLAWKLKEASKCVEKLTNP